MHLGTLQRRRPLSPGYAPPAECQDYDELATGDDFAHFRVAAYPVLSRPPRGPHCCSVCCTVFSFVAVIFLVRVATWLTTSRPRCSTATTAFDDVTVLTLCWLRLGWRVGGAELPWAADRVAIRVREAGRRRRRR